MAAEETNAPSSSSSSSQQASSRSYQQRLVFPSLFSTGIVTFLRIAWIFLSRAKVFGYFIPKVWLHSPAVVSLFVKRHQTFDHVEEAVAIQQLFSGQIGDAYQANKTIRIPPVLLDLISKFKALEEDDAVAELWLALAMLLVDFVISVLLEAIARHVLFYPSEQTDREEALQREMDEKIRPSSDAVFPLERGYSDSKQQQPRPQFEMSSLPLLAAQVYFWSPITALAGGTYGCFQSLVGLFVLSGLYEAMRPTGSYSWSAFFLAMASYIEPHSLVFLVPACVWAGESAKSKLTMIGLFLVWTGSFQYLSFSLVGPHKYTQVLDATYGWSWDHLRPNLSVIWYFQMQLFDRFRTYFEFLITGLPYILVTPLTIRLHRYPEALVAAFWMIWSIFRSTSTLHDLNLGLCLLFMSPRSLARVNAASLVALFCLCGPIVLYVVDCWMWLETGSGNANYIFFQCLAYNAFLGIILCQFVNATMKRDKALRLTLENVNDDVVSSGHASAHAKRD